VAISGWRDLDKYRVVYLNGWKIFENNLSNSGEIVKVARPEQLFRMLERDRADVVLYERWQGLHLSAQLGIDNVRAIDPPLVDMKMYMYLNKKHAVLAPKVARALRAMKEDGTYQRLYDQILEPLRP